MPENKTVVNIFGWSTKIWIIYGILGYFVYAHNIDAVLGVLVLSFIVGTVFVLSVIPVLGWIAAMLLNWYYVIPKLMVLTNLDMTWLIQIIYIIDGIVGLFITGATTLVVVAALYK